MPAGLTPIYRILKNDVDITDHFNDRTTLVQVDINEGNGNGDYFKVQLDDRGWLIALPQTGALLNIELGYKEIGLAQQGTFQIDEVYLEGPPKTMRLNGNSAGMKNLMKAPALKDFENKSVTDIIQEIGKKGGLSVAIDEAFGNLKIPMLNQFQSNYHLLHELERRFGAVAKIEFGKLIFTSRDNGKSTSGLNLPTVVLRPEHFASWSVRLLERPKFTSVKAAWWNEALGKTQYEEEKNGDVGTRGEGAGNSNPFIMNRRFSSKQEALEAAKSYVGLLNRSTGELTCELAKGDPWIRAQYPLLVQGMRDGINGMYIIQQVTHTYVKETGLKTKIVARPPAKANAVADRLEPENFIDPGRLGPGGRLGGSV